MNENITTRIERVEDDVDDKWYWPSDDTGAWDGPLMNWVKSHNVKYFKYVGKYGTCVTAGANCGLYVRMYAKRFKHVYAFEPEPLNYKCLTLNCPYDNVYNHNMALGDKNTNCVVDGGLIGTCDSKNRGMFKVNESPEGGVKMITIDSLNLTECDLIQLDVEGYEWNAVMGAMETIKKFKPVVITEREDNRISNLLTPLGYTMKDASFADHIYSI